ncbi:MAG: hypothetical protein P9M06_01000 [Candidatus Saelkia tenebricola]|nr:hypothetical protein [Candidatus Saelkia tenebricola]
MKNDFYLKFALIITTTVILLSLSINLFSDISSIKTGEKAESCLENSRHGKIINLIEKRKLSDKEAMFYSEIKQ